MECILFELKKLSICGIVACIVVYLIFIWEARKDGVQPRKGAEGKDRGTRKEN
jgi:hypothetical protein